MDDDDREDPKETAELDLPRDSTIPPHDRRAPHESRQAYHAFVHYRDLGMNRSINSAWVEHRVKCLKRAKPSGSGVKESGTWRTWSAKWKWVRRADGRDVELEKIGMMVQDESRKAMVLRHAQIAVTFMDKVKERLETLDPQELSPREVIQWYDVAAKIERLSRGEKKSEEVLVDTPGIIEVHAYPERKIKRVK